MTERLGIHAEARTKPYKLILLSFIATPRDMCNVSDVFRFDATHSPVHVVTIDQAVHRSGGHNVVLHTVTTDRLNLLELILVERRPVRTVH